MPSSRRRFRPNLDEARVEPRQLLSVAVAASPTIRALDAADRTFTNLDYTSNPADPRLLDVFLPSGERPAGGWPVVLAIHGGSWQLSNKSAYESQVVRPLLAGGFAVVVPNYALSLPGKPSWPLDPGEMWQAVEWIDHNATHYGFDPSKLAALGSSAGAQLALLLGSHPAVGIARVAAVVDYYGPSDLTSLAVLSPALTYAITDYLGSTPATFDALSAAASPVQHITSSSAPTLIVHGTKDNFVPIEQSRELAAELSRYGVPYEFVAVKGGGHNFPLNYDHLAPVVVSYLRRTLGIDKKA